MERDTYQALLERLRGAAESYYRGEESGMDDAEYDRLYAEVAAAERQNPEWGDAAASLVGHAVGGRRTLPHRVPMLSLDNVFDRESLDAWIDGTGGAEVTVEPKLDGLAISVTYRAGRRARIVTRGDGREGEDVTAAPAVIAGMPDRLTEDLDLEVRGEICMTADDFSRENRIRESEGERTLSNPRNAAAGAMLALPGRRAVRLSFWAYDCPELPGGHEEVLERLRSLGVRVSLDLWSARVGEPAADAVERLGTERANLPVSIDGAVIKASRPEDRVRLGTTRRAPRWAIAYKYPAELRRSVLRAIELQVGRGGSITPVGKIDTVHVGGADISSVTLHNPGEVKRKDLRIGDTVWVRRAGDVIPEIVGPDLSTRPRGAVPWQPPSACPDCSGAVDTSGARLRCVRRCGAVAVLRHAAGRDALDIDGAGGELIAAAYAAGILSDIPSLYDLAGRADDLAALEVNGRRFGSRRAARSAASARAASGLPLERHLLALGLPGVGRTVAQNLAQRFPDLAAIVEAGPEELASSEGVGSTRAADIARDLEGRAEEISRVLARIRPALSAPPAPSGPLSGQTFAITGRLTLRTRSELTREIERQGGRVVSGVTPRTSFLVRGEGGGAKSRDAARHGVTVLDEQQFERKLRATGGDDEKH